MLKNWPALFLVSAGKLALGQEVTLQRLEDLALGSTGAKFENLIHGI